MELGVVQMLASGDRDEDLAAMLRLLGDACSRGAETVVLPGVPSLMDDDEARAAFLAEGGVCPEGVTVLVPFATREQGRPQPQETPLGRTLSLTGDECIDPAMHGIVRAAAPNALVLRPEPESALQAEAVLELALGYSTSLAGLVVLCSLAAPDPGGVEPFGGSAVIEGGELLAEAVDPDEAVVASVHPPVALQRPPSPVPEPQLILRQRLAHHQGRKAEVDWLADLD